MQIKTDKSYLNMSPIFKFSRFAVLLLLIPCLAYSQQNIKVLKSEFKTGDEAGFEEAWKSIKAGDKLFKAGPGTYRDARQHYLFADKYNSENPELNYKIGVCYLYTDDKFEAIKYFRKAYIANNKISSDIHYMLARAYNLALDFDRAIEEYNKYLTSLSPKQMAKESSEIRRMIQQCGNGKALVAEPVRVIINNVGENINSEADDYNSIFGSGDSIMYFTSRRMHEERAKRSDYDNKFFENIYTSVRQGTEWSKAENLGKKVNGKNHNTAALSVTGFGSRLYIYQGQKDGGNIYESKLKNGEWTVPKPIKGKLNTKYRETSLSITPDQKKLYFVSSNPKVSMGGRDIFVVSKNSQGKWENPVNIGSRINTPFDEECVNISPDGNTLYFSSKGHNSMGGYDIFRSDKNDLGEWQPPVNLGYPINTPDDELFYSVSPVGKYAYYSANRMGTIGGRDIYRLLYLGAEKEFVMLTEDILIAGIQDSARKGFLTEPGLMKIDTTYILTGKVKDGASGDGIMAQLEFIDVDQSKVIATTLSNDTGTYTARLPQGKAYGVEINAKGYLFYIDIVDLTGKIPEEPIRHDFNLDKVEVGTKVVLENIFFETNKATLKPESYPQLEQVLKFLDSNPSVRMEISGHTDNTGSLKLNTNLSQARAESVVRYLVERGVDPSRLDAKGYAYSQPIAPNDTAEGRAKNRRVEFKILSM
jgi:outer membrane protein OmpA-like peptidoglycan-associated protein/tetratricopeptide (TPR) repeat protein